MSNVNEIQEKDRNVCGSCFFMWVRTVKLPLLALFSLATALHTCTPTYTKQFVVINVVKVMTDAV